MMILPAKVVVALKRHNICDNNTKYDKDYRDNENNKAN